MIWYFKWSTSDISQKWHSPDYNSELYEIFSIKLKSLGTTPVITKTLLEICHPKLAENAAAVHHVGLYDSTHFWQ